MKEYKYMLAMYRIAANENKPGIPEISFLELHL